MDIAHSAVPAAVQGALRILTPNAGPGDQLAIIGSTDLDQAFYDTLFQAATRLHLKPTLGLMPPLSAPGRPAPPPLVAHAARADTVLFTGSMSCAHSSTALEVLAAGKRIITFPVPAGVGSALRYLAGQRNYDTARLRQLKSSCLAVSRVLDAGHVAEVHSPQGTQLTVSIAGRKSHAWYGIADADGHMITAWPPGETHVAAVEGTADGTVVVDGYISGIGVSAPALALTFREGVLTGYTGGASSQLGHFIDALDHSARVFCEVGIGVNPWQPVTGTNADKNALGTWHMAIGTNASACFGGCAFDGANHSDIHLDFVSSQDCSLTIDDIPVVSKNQFILTNTNP